MFNLFIIMFILSETKLQKVQYPIENIKQEETIAWIWYTQRPINQKTQVRNTYLDSCTISATQQLPVPSWAWEWVVVSWYTYNTVWKYSFVWQNTNEIKIPTTWTYSINVRIIINDSFWDLWLSKYEILKNWNELFADWKLTLSYFESMNIIWTENFKSNDILKIQINADDETQIRTLNIKTTIIKLY